jgi:hypothetical protein
VAAPSREPHDGTADYLSLLAWESKQLAAVTEDELPVRLIFHRKRIY